MPAKNVTIEARLPEPRRWTLIFTCPKFSLLSFLRFATARRHCKPLRLVLSTPAFLSFGIARSEE